MLLSPGEVVIVDFHRFPIGFTSAFQHGAIRHRRLATMIRDELGSLAAKVSLLLFILFTAISAINL